MATEAVKDICYCISMRRATGKLSDYYNEVLKPAGLTINQFWLLGNVSRLDNCSVVQLANVVDQDKSTLARTLKPLFNQGLIQDTSIKGSRNRQMSLTKDGVRTLYRANLLWQDAQDRVEKELGIENVDLLLGMLNVVEQLDSLPNTVVK